MSDTATPAARTGADSTTSDTTPEVLEATLESAVAASTTLAASGPAVRADWLRACADALDAAVEELVPLAMAETSLPQPRLAGEITRSSGQFRMFADAVADGTLLELMIDHTDATKTPPRPDLRRMLIPMGPVLVFAASNFPFAFSVCGGDTASALAAGCPVVVKAHPGHPQTSRATAAVLARALADAGAPDGALALIEGFEVGVSALKDPRIKAAAFTGSVPAGVALHAIASSRPDPIPFYGELGSVNPVFALPGAVATRGADLAAEYVGSLSLGVGQFCTSPGLLFLPTDSGLTDAIVSAAAAVAPAKMLNANIRNGFEAGAARVQGVGGVEVLQQGSTDEHGAVSPTVLRTAIADLLDNWDELTEECFGPLSIVVEYADPAELPALARRLAGNLTATVHTDGSAGDEAAAAALVPELAARVGRVVFNGWPTGVAVTWAMEHGGPFPATVGTNVTSVGTTAARRFQRPVCFQDTPAALLPAELREDSTSLVRRIDGVLGTH